MEYSTSNAVCKAIKTPAAYLREFLSFSGANGCFTLTEAYTYSPTDYEATYTLL